MSDFSFKMPELPEIKVPSFKAPVIPPNPQVTSIKENLAEQFVVRLVAMINEYNMSLDANKQVALSLVQFGQTLTLSVENIGYWNPSLIVFYGTSADGLPMRLIQHVSQINCLLTAVPRENINEPKRRIGFAIESQSAPTEK
ncbi:DUF6173 family protein [Alicyclobacillus macrosporangiidus]|uniref:Uncharacterized protein n=1 Tax=Alicyclobacillus macrosporangiidus TaxID=392015 RepID=A0A1I7ID81_9BACL|nr:DUF6173 family protein [Alicyclobacillus macrosporangiidus]SFU70858.1 hypothetical protein SAMN05421543_106148 [Alicyclobacillus macrosporangiidus]